MMTLTPLALSVLAIIAVVGGGIAAWKSKTSTFFANELSSTLWLGGLGLLGLALVPTPLMALGFGLLAAVFGMAVFATAKYSRWPLLVIAGSLLILGLAISAMFAAIKEAPSYGGMRRALTTARARAIARRNALSSQRANSVNAVGVA